MGTLLYVGAGREHGGAVAGGVDLGSMLLSAVDESAGMDLGYVGIWKGAVGVEHERGGVQCCTDIQHVSLQ